MIDWVEETAQALEGARRVVVLTGAGMSQDSGIPTFRDALTGLWARYNPEDLATESAFRRNPAIVFGWYLWRWQLARRAKPHAGYWVLPSLDRVYEELVIATQNVDGLHRRVGSRTVVELHGSLDSFRCLDCAHPYDARRLARVRVPEDGAVEPPLCDECKSPIRPGIVWFGEPVPTDALARGCQAAEMCDGMLVVGTSALVYPAADLPTVALAAGVPVIEINPDRTALSSRATVSWRERAKVALPALAQRIRSGVSAR